MNNPEASTFVNLEDKVFTIKIKISRRKANNVDRF